MRALSQMGLFNDIFVALSTSQKPKSVFYINIPTVWVWHTLCVMMSLQLSMVKEKLLTTTNPAVITSPPPSSIAPSVKPPTTSTATVTLSPAKQPTTTSSASKSSLQVSDYEALLNRNVCSKTTSLQ